MSTAISSKGTKSPLFTTTAQSGAITTTEVATEENKTSGTTEERSMGTMSRFASGRTLVGVLGAYLGMLEQDNFVSAIQEDEVLQYLLKYHHNPT